MARVPREARTSRRDVYAEVTARIVAALERGTVPWRHPWRSRGHRNALSGRPYRGVNLLVLGLTALEQGYADARWLTFHQAAARGGHVRRGERGTRIVLWKWVERASAEEERERAFPLLRLYTVFNIAQCEHLTLADDPPTAAIDPLSRAEAIVAGYVGGPAVLHDAGAAYYLPTRDEVHLPPRDDFRSAQGYYATLFHELAHSTGHPSRLDREGYQSSASFGSPVYSREELVAEFAAAFLCHEAGIDGSQTGQSAAYIAAWLRALQDDHRMVVVAAGRAQSAADHILGCAPAAVHEPQDSR